MSEGAQHHDAGKPRVDLIPPEAITAAAMVFGWGATKYSDRNWEKGMAWGKIFGSLMRHLWAFWRREELDPESGLPHLAHALANLMMLYWLMVHRADLDDRTVISVPHTNSPQ